MAKQFTIAIRNVNHTVWLDTYGPTADEIEFTIDRQKCFRMERDSAYGRLPTVQQFHPDAEVVSL